MMGKKSLNKPCHACKGAIEILGVQEKKQQLCALDSAWQINDQGHLERCFHFVNFVAAMDFANQVTQLAEQAQHHPDLSIAWGKCVVEIWTHKIQDLTSSDFMLAAKIDDIMT